MRSLPAPRFSLILSRAWKTLCTMYIHLHRRVETLNSSQGSNEGTSGYVKKVKIESQKQINFILIHGSLFSLLCIRKRKIYTRKPAQYSVTRLKSLFAFGWFHRRQHITSTDHGVFMTFWPFHNNYVCASIRSYVFFVCTVGSWLA